MRSMAATMSVPTPYDHTRSYVGCYDASMLYYTANGSMPVCGSKDVINKTSNRCDASLNLYDKGVVIDPVGPLEKHGFYADQIAQYNSKQNVWQATLTRNPGESAQLIECYTDSGVHGDAGPGNPYIADAGPWTERLRYVRPNAAKMEQVALCKLGHLEDGDPIELGQQMGEVARRFPSVDILGGCCGTDERHLAEIARNVNTIMAAGRQTE